MNLLPDTTSASLINHVHHMDIFELCERVYRAGIQVDCILADLPYGTTACAWDEVIPFAPMWEAFRRVIKPRGAIVLTASQPFTSALVMSNPKWFKHEWIWNKHKATNHANALIAPLRLHESVCIFSDSVVNYYPQFEKGVPYKGTSRQRSNGVWNGLGEKRKDNPGIRYPKSILDFAFEFSPVHPTQKPLPLFEYLVNTYTLPGEIVLDPVCGSGTTARAALRTGRRFIVGDNSAEYVAITKDSLRNPFEARHVLADNRVDDLPLFAIAAGE